jgi:cyclase
MKKQITTLTLLLAMLFFASCQKKENDDDDAQQHNNHATSWRIITDEEEEAEQAQKIFNLGVEKVALSSSVIHNPSLISEIAERVGNQSVIVVLDVKKKIFGNYEIYTHNGKKSTGIDPIEFAVKAQELGAGEIIINSIDNDGMMKGFDMNIINKIRQVVKIPLTVLGGAGSLNDIEKVIKEHGVIGVGAGSLFVFKGVYKAVLISYPSKVEKSKMFKNLIKIDERN